jgi:hypothetical protein
MQDHARFDVVLCGFGRHRDDGGVGNLWQGPDRRLQFKAWDILAFSSQDVCLAVDEGELTAWQSASRVAGVVPKAREGLHRRFRPALSPLAVFTIWMILLSVTVLRAIKDEEHQQMWSDLWGDRFGGGAAGPLTIVISEDRMPRQTANTWSTCRSVW